MGLFWLDRDNKARTSLALWIPLTWFMLTCSRPVSNWLNLNTPVDKLAAAASQIEGNPVERAVGGTLIALGLLVIAKRHKVVSNLQYYWPLLLFLTYCLLSLTWSEFPDVALKRLIREAGNLVMIAVVWTDPSPLAAFKRLLNRTAYTLIPLSILFCRYYPFGRSYGYWTGLLSYTGVSEDKNGLAQLCLICGLASIWQLFTLLDDGQTKVRRARHLAVHITVLAMVIYLFVLADSATSRACMVLATILMVVIRWRVFRRTRILIHALVLVVVAVPVGIAILGASPAALQAMGRDATLTDRTLIWSWVLKLVPNPWVGAGYASFWLGRRLDLIVENVTHTWIPNQAHNGYLDIYANLGWVGIALLGVVIFCGYARIIRLWRCHHPAGDLMLAYFVVGVISNISEATFFRNMFPVWLVFMLAITVPRIEIARRKDGSRVQPGPVGLRSKTGLRLREAAAVNS